MFLYPQKVLFKHCDPAGIVFYPRYIEMLNDVVEAFFIDELDTPFSELIRGNGVPTVKLDATFSAPSRLGDELVIALAVTRLGRSSVDLNFDTHCAQELRFSANLVLVFVDDNGKPTSWPTYMRRSIQNHLQETE